MDMVRNYENSHKWQDGKHTVPPSSPPWALLVLTEAVKAGLLRFSREGLSFLLLCKQSGLGCTLLTHCELR